MTTSVKDPRHVVVLLAAGLDRVRERFDPDAWDGLRQSHFRMLSSVPTGGERLTDLARRLRMTKQGCGQFVAGLADRGLLAVDPDPSDRRARLVRRTPAGDDVVAGFEAEVAALERTWSRRVGARDYATFRRVLAEIGRSEGP